MILETARLKIVPLTAEQFRRLLCGKDKLENELGLCYSGVNLDENTQQAMESLYKKSVNYPEKDYLWFTKWQIILKSENKAVGSFCFILNSDDSDIIEIGYGIDDTYQNIGIMTETLDAVYKWLLKNSDFKYLVAETNKDNFASQKVLQNIGMQKYYETSESVLWRIRLNNILKSENMEVISVRENPEFKDIAIKYIQSKWPSVPGIVYEDSINHSINPSGVLPQWYLLKKEEEIIGCAGLITNDFISRMDLYPWICALFIEEKYRGNSYSYWLIEKAKKDSRKAGFENLYLSTHHVGFYEKFGFEYIGQGYHPWDEESRIYSIKLKNDNSFKIRQETEKDLDEVYNLIQTAFKTAKVKDGTEQDFAVGLRNSNGFIPELALVAEKDNRLIGHIMLTRTFVENHDGSKYETLLLAPVSVLIEYRDLGVGSALINESIKRAGEMSFKTVFLCGDPNYYCRFGFKSITNYGIKSKNNIPEQFVLAYEIEPDALKDVSGAVDAC